jgi:predicted PurR-regulated permease PerM
MFIWVIKSTIISLILIALVHYLYTFFKTTLTVPKIKDLVDYPQQQYKEIINTIQSPSISIKKNSAQSSLESSSATQINSNSQENMKNELKNYLSSLHKDSKSIVSYGESNQYSNY